MGWLMTQIWLELLVAAAIGGGIGWILHRLYLKQAPFRPAPLGAEAQLPSPEGKERIAELEARLARAEAETDDLRNKSGIMPLGYRGQPPEGSLAWRNRILESRVRFLEGRLADLEGEGALVHPSDGHSDEATRLRWRNRYLAGRVKYLEEELVRAGGLKPATVALAEPQPDSARPMPSDGDKPELLEQPREGRADDLKMISGIGPKLEQKLNGIGVWHYAQIASWTQKEIDWVNTAISFVGRIERENWVDQAVALIERGRASDLESATEAKGA
jgi:predicted flap endonuclease-1-like 5' DNA nuclease